MSAETSGRVINIFTAPTAGAPMEAHQKIHAIPGIGLKGDRYALGTGAFSKGKRHAIRHVSLIAIEAINAANEEAGLDYLPEETRRNLLTEDIDLNEFVGRSFHIGQVVLFGTELCDPCKRPERLSGKPGFEAAFQESGGLRAQIFRTGTIEVGDLIIPGM